MPTAPASTRPPGRRTPRIARASAATARLAADHQRRDRRGDRLLRRVDPQRTGIKQPPLGRPPTRPCSRHVGRGRRARRSPTPASRPSQVDAVVVATVSHLLQTPAVATAVAHGLGTQPARGVRHLRGLRRLLLRRRARLRHGPRRQRQARPGHRRGEALRLHRRRSTAAPRSSSPTAPARSSSVPPTSRPSARSCGAPTASSTTSSGRREDWRDVLEQEDPRMPHLVMQGHPVFRWAVFEMAKVAQTGARPAGVTADDLDVFVPHQANMRIIDAMVRSMKLPEHVRVARDIAETGQHLGGLDPARDGAHARGGRGQERRHRSAHRLRRRAGLRRPGRHGPLTGVTFHRVTPAARRSTPSPPTEKESHPWPPARRSSPISPRSSTRSPAVDADQRPARQVVHRRPRHRLAVDGRGRRRRRGEVRREDPRRRGQEPQDRRRRRRLHRARRADPPTDVGRPTGDHRGHPSGYRRRSQPHPDP